MSHKRVIVLSMDVHDFGRVFNSPTYMKDTLLNLVKNTYERRCYAGMYIKEVVGILEHTPACVTDDGPPKYVSISMRVEVLGERYDNSGIIADMVIENISDDLLICSSQSQECKAIVNVGDFKSLTIGDYLPVIVDSAVYKPGLQSVTSKGIPYTPVVADCVFLMTELAPNVNLDPIRAMINDGLKILGSMSDENKKSIGTELSQFKNGEPKVAKKVTILDILDNPTQYNGAIMSIYNIGKLDPSVEIVAQSDKPVFDQGYNAIALIAKNFLNNVQLADYILRIGTKENMTKLARLIKVWRMLKK